MSKSAYALVGRTTRLGATITKIRCVSLDGKALRIEAERLNNIKHTRWLYEVERVPLLPKVEA